VENSVIIVIDGYNLLKAVFHRVKGKLDKERQQLIRNLGFYKKLRPKISDIVLVFDGGYSSRATREIRGGVVVIFSGQKQDADHWIIDYVERNKNKEITLITRDRELIDSCKKQAKSLELEVVYSVDFYEIMQKALLKEVEQDLKKGVASESVKKYKKDEIGGLNPPADSDALDLLMEQTPLDLYEKDDEVCTGSAKRGKSRKLSKKERKRQERLKKL
jgi:predicted RNA-binding protein with PIN domain